MRGMRKKVARVLVCALALGVALVASPALAGGDNRLSGTVNINTASAEQLQLLPGVGETRARALIEERKHRGGFKSVDELLDVKGIGDASLDRLRPFVTVDGKTTAKLE